MDKMKTVHIANGNRPLCGSRSPVIYLRWIMSFDRASRNAVGTRRDMIVGKRPSCPGDAS